MLNSPLINGLPKFTFDASFKNGIFIEEVFYSNIEDKEELIEAVLGCNDWNEINYFMSCGDFYDSKSQAVAICRPYSFIYDWGAIYTAFLQQYHIDLLDSDMHYWKFVQLFRGLKGTLFNDIMSIRQMDLTQIKDRQARREMQNLKNYYRLPQPRTEEDELIEEFNKKFG